MRNFKKDKKNKTKFLTGFTLVEMLIVTAIIGILATITSFSFIKARPKARLANVQAQMISLQAYLVICENDGDVVDFTVNVPVIGDTICEHANSAAIFQRLISNWKYTTSDNQGSYRACTSESDTWEIICDETGCVTNTPAACL